MIITNETILNEEASYWLSFNYSDAFIESKMFEKRNSDISIDDIKKAIENAKNLKDS